MKFYKLLFVLIGITAFSFAQTKTNLTGLVLNIENKTAVADANIKIIGTNINTTTDNKGNFSLSINSNSIDNRVLEISSIGYLSQRIKIGQKTNFKILLETEKSQLSEVIVTSSYGTKKRKEDLVGSIVNIKASDLQVKQSIESFDKMLDGIAAGVQITSSSVVGAPVKINIRGQGTITPLNSNLLNTSTQPLIIIDGIIMSEEAGFDSDFFDGGALSEQFKNPLSKISPEDIETISILKDAAAVGLYGADGANGVIIVTTKRSKSKKPDFTFSTQTGFSNPINQIKYLSGPEYYDIYKEYRKSQGDTESQASTSAGSRTINTDWFDLLNRTGSFNRYNFNTTFGYNNWNFRTSINVLDNQEAQKSNNFVRYSGSVNLGYSNKKFNIQTSILPSLIEQNEPNTLFNFPLRPNIAPYNDDGSFAILGNRTFGNPLAVAEQNLSKTKTLGILASINLQLNIFKNLKLSNILGIDFSDKIQNKYFSALNESGQFNGTFLVQNQDGTSTTFNRFGRRLDATRKNFKWNQSTQLSYEKKTTMHAFDGIIGLELQREKVDNQRRFATGFVNPGPINEVEQAAEGFASNDYLSVETRRSVFGQMNYNFKQKYFILANIRRDESSAFGNDVNAAINSGVGISWNISSEKFLESNKFINFLRIRTSYGVTGNSRIGSYRSKGLYNVDVSGSDGYNGDFVAFPSSAPNPNLSWERNYKFNIGIDFNFAQKQKLTIEYFRDNITDIISSTPISLETGFPNIQINGSSMVNSGLEFSLNSTWFMSNNFRWTTAFNISTINNEVTSLSTAGSQYSTTSRAAAQKIGFSTTAIWGAKFEGIDPATGRELYSQNNQIYDAATYATLFNQENWEVIGDRQPDFYGGFQNSFTFYKNLTLSFRARFTYGGQELIDNDLESVYSTLLNKNMSVNILDRWRQQGDLAQFPRVSGTNPIIFNSSKFLYDDSDIKIQNINLNYELPLKSMKIKTFDSIGFSVDVSNVYYFYKQKSPADRNGIREYKFRYPEARTVTFGCQVNF